MNAMILGLIEVSVQNLSNRASSAWINLEFDLRQERHPDEDDALFRSHGLPVERGGKPDPHAGDSCCSRLRLKQSGVQYRDERILYPPMSMGMKVYLDSSIRVSKKRIFNATTTYKSF